jgi:predicted Zn-ribbon and HTH transcriptional regulator
VKKKSTEPLIPVERQETIRREIISVLVGKTLSAKDISADVRVSEKEIYEHLEHIQRTISKSEHNFIVTPAECKKCGFIFRKRDRLKKPGRCPVCRGESIQEPLFSIRKKG